MPPIQLEPFLLKWHNKDLQNNLITEEVTAFEAAADVIITDNLIGVSAQFNQLEKCFTICH